MLNVISDVEQVQGKCYDYIVVGGGACGCPLAATLSERFTVLLVERGGSPFEDPLIMEKKNFFRAVGQMDEYTSIMQKVVSEDGVVNYRGRVLGGGTAINGGVYTRCNKDYIERAGWDEKLVKEAYEWIESRIVFEPKKLSIEQSYAKDIFVGAGILPYNGYSLEHVEGTKIIGSLFDEKGMRHSSANLLQGGDTNRLTVLLNATVKNIIFIQDDEGKPRASRIRFINSHGSVTTSYEAFLNPPSDSETSGDVILCAGAMGSPQILMLSGIGPYEHLNRFNIETLHNSPQVGQDIRDHPGLMLPLEIREVLDPQGDPSQVVGITKDSRFLIQYGGSRISNTQQRRSLLVKLAHPSSKGNLELKSTDPRQNPGVRYNYLLEENDVNECVEMVDEVRKVARSIDLLLGTSYDRVIYDMILGENKEEESNGLEIVISDEQVKKFCKVNKVSYLHSHGGCCVGSVVDENYKVNGVEGVRVVDASALNELMSTSPMGTLLMLGRYQGVKMLRERGMSMA